MLALTRPSIDVGQYACRKLPKLGWGGGFGLANPPHREGRQGREDRGAIFRSVWPPTGWPGAAPSGRSGDGQGVDSAQQHALAKCPRADLQFGQAEQVHRGVGH
jgi:hypothetical protein